MPSQGTPDAKPFVRVRRLTPAPQRLCWFHEASVRTSCRVGRAFRAPRPGQSAGSGGGCRGDLCDALLPRRGSCRRLRAGLPVSGGPRSSFPHQCGSARGRRADRPGRLFRLAGEHRRRNRLGADCPPACSTAARLRTHPAPASALAAEGHWNETPKENSKMKKILFAALAVVALAFTAAAAAPCTCSDCGGACCPCDCQAGCC